MDFLTKRRSVTQDELSPFVLDPNETETNAMPEVTKSDLLGKLLAGIPGVSGYPITKQAEDKLADDRVVEAAQMAAQAVPETPKPEFKNGIDEAKKSLAMVQKPVVQSAPEIPTERTRPVPMMPFGEPDQEAPEMAQAAPQIPQASKAPEMPADMVELLAAQQARKDKLNQLNTVEGIAQILHGLTKSSQKFDPNIFANSRKMADMGLTELQEKRGLKKEQTAEARQKVLDERSAAAESRDIEKFKTDQEKNALMTEQLKKSMANEDERRDPNSLASQGVREFQKQRFQSLSQLTKGAVKYDPTAFDKMSAEQLEQAFGKFSPENIASAIVTNERVKEEHALKREDQKVAREDKKLAGQAKAQEKLEGDIQSYRKEATGGPVNAALYKNYLTSNKMAEAINEFKKNPNGYTDYATLMGGLKALQGDDSVVREAEMRMGMQAGSLTDKVNNWASQISSGKTLQPGQREAIINTIQTMGNISKRNYLDTIAPLMKQAQERGVDPAKILPETINKEEKAKSKYSAAEEAGIENVMKNNPGATREQVIKELIKAGKIK